MRLMRFSSVTIVALLAVTVSRGAEFKVDPVHSKVMFRVRHLGISTVTGRFAKFSAMIEFDPNHFEQSHVEAHVQVASVDTGVERRDNDLRSARFFDAAQYPEMLFVSTRVEKVSEREFKVHGNLTMHGVTRPLVLDATLGGVIQDPWGNRRAAFQASATINRTEWGLKYNQLLESGGLLVGEEVEILLEVEAVQRKESTP